MTVFEFLDILERNQLVEPRLVDDFRKQVARVKREVDAKEIARLLVAHGDLTAKQAFRVLSNRPKAMPPTLAAREPTAAAPPVVPSTPATPTRCSRR